MIIKEIFFDNYRNLKKGNLEACENVNVIYGANAQGKTNLLELIWLFTGGKSFRGFKDKELIRFGENKSEISAKFFSDEREKIIKIIISGESSKVKKTAYLNNVYKDRCSLLIGNFCCVVFSPTHLNLVKDGPSFRRKFIDGAICQIEPAYVYTLTKYNRILNQRNAILKQLGKSKSKNSSLLEVWDEGLIEFAEEIAKKRISYCNKLKKYTDSIYKKLSVNNESINIDYSTNCNKENLKSKLKSRLESDIIMGSTSVGPHRDDINISLNNRVAKNFASQGQQRFIVLALKLAEAKIIEESINEKPVVLLDDVMSELDSERQNYLLNNIDGLQVFITCCEKNDLISKSNAKLFKIVDGKIE